MKVVERWSSKDSTCRVRRSPYGEMNRKTGRSQGMKYEVTVKLAGQPKRVHVFTGPGAAWNARITATAAWFGVSLSCPLVEMPSKLGRALRDLEALSGWSISGLNTGHGSVGGLQRPGEGGNWPKVKFLGSRARINSGDSEAVSRPSLWVAQPPLDSSQALSTALAVNISPSR